MTTPHGAASAKQLARSSTPLARLGRTYQLAGAVRCRPVDDAAAAAVLGARTLLVEGHGVLSVRDVRRHADALVIAFQGYRSPERAQALVNALVFADPDDLETLAALVAAQPLRVGMAVTRDGAAFGVVEAVLQGAQPLLSVRAADAVHLVPANAPYVVVGPDAIDLRDAPPGLLGEPADG